MSFESSALKLFYFLDLIPVGFPVTEIIRSPIGSLNRETVHYLGFYGGRGANFPPDFSDYRLIFDRYLAYRNEVSTPTTSTIKDGIRPI